MQRPGGGLAAMVVASLSARKARNRFLVALLLGGCTVTTAARVRRYLRHVRRDQQALASSSIPAGRGGVVSAPTRRVAAVDRLFLKRLVAILRVCIPSATSREAMLVVVQGLLLFSRTLLSDRIARLEGMCAANVTALNWPGFGRTVINFALTAIPAAIVNSALKAMQLAIRLAMRRKLSNRLHRMYLTHRAYYTASAMGGLVHAEQRITEDTDKFCESLSELYSKTLKPMLDLIVFSRSLSDLIGYRGQAILYAYFIGIASVLRGISPPLAKLTAQYSALDGAFRHSHARLASKAEEIAFCDPPAGRAEMLSLDRRLEVLVRHSKLTAIQRFVSECISGYLVKYTASVVGLGVHAAPMFFAPPSDNTNVLAGRYVNSMRLMMQAASAMGELVQVYKRILSLAGHTARVSEIMEQVKEIAGPQGHLTAFRNMQGRVVGNDSEDDEITVCAKNCPPVRKYGPTIKLEKVTLWSPDGTKLVNELYMEVAEGRSVIIVGPNGSGKSSILRMLAGLWPLQSGSVFMPARDDVFYLSQRPYTYEGSLGEQLMYPNLPGAVVGENAVLDEELAKDVLRRVELESLFTRCGGFDGAVAWDEVLSGGERARLAVARLLYHKPRFAVLDECTAAVSAAGELVLYQAMKDAGITLLSVAHRDAVWRFHDDVVTMDADDDWKVTSVQEAQLAHANGVAKLEKGVANGGIHT